MTGIDISKLNDKVIGLKSFILISIRCQNIIVERLVTLNLLKVSVSTTKEQQVGSKMDLMILSLSMGNLI